MKNNMKPSGIDWIGDIPAGWEAKPIKYILESNQSSLKETTRSDYTFRYIDISSVDFEKGIIGYEEMNFEKAPSRARRIVKKGDTIISTVRTYLKAIARIEDDEYVIVSTGFAVLSPKGNDPVFIEYYCKSDVFCSEIEKLSYGIAYPAINESVLINIKMILPPHKEQQAIAAILDTQCGTIDSIIAEMEQQIDVLKQYKTALITETVTKGLDKTAPMKDSGIDWIGKIPLNWKTGRIKNLMTLQRGYDLAQDNFVEGSIPVYGSNGIVGYHNKMTTKGPNITIGRSGSVGEINFIETDFWAHNTSIYVDDTKNNFCRYLYFVLRSIDIKTLGNGSAVPTLDRKDVQNVKFAFTQNINEQKAISDFLDTKIKKTDELITEKQQSIETMQEYKKSLIYEYVTGKKRTKGA